LPKKIKVETTDEIDKMKAARKRVGELEVALADAHMDYCLESAFLNIACERLGTTKECHDACRKAKDRGGRHGGRAAMPQAWHEPAELLQRAQLRQWREGDNGLIERLVRDKRTAQPRLGGKKLFHIWGPKLASLGEKIGRDRFFAVLREKSLLLEKLSYCTQGNEQPAQSAGVSQSGQGHGADRSQSGMGGTSSISTPTKAMCISV
jgi:hypothetical protein